MAAVTGLTLVKLFSYRGDAQEEFSNTYHFKGLPPGDDASWNVLLNDVVTQEKVLWPSTVKMSRAYGYNSDDPNAHHVFAHDYGTTGPPGTFVPQSADHRMAGDQAACIWWKMDRLSSRGKPIYLRKYMHSGFTDQINVDNISSLYGAQLDQYASTMKGIHGGLRSRSHDDNVVAQGHIPYATTRTLKRRGKRPKTGS